MKKLLFLIFLLIPTLVFAEANVTITWNPNSESDLEGYEFYQRIEGEEFDFENCTCDIPAGTETYTAEGLEDNTYYFCLKAYDEHGNMSESSEVIICVIDTIPPAKVNGVQITNITIVQ